MQVKNTNIKIKDVRMTINYVGFFNKCSKKVGFVENVMEIFVFKKNYSLSIFQVLKKKTHHSKNTFNNTFKS